MSVLSVLLYLRTLPIKELCSILLAAAATRMENVDKRDRVAGGDCSQV